MPCSTCPNEKVFALGMCQGCYYRLRRNGSVARKNVQNKGRSCTEGGCDKRAFSKGLCQAHYDASQHPLKDSWKLLRSRSRGQYPASWDSFDAFLADVGERPSDRHQLRRIDVTLPYAPGNWQWLEPVVVLDCYSPEDRSAYERAWRFKTKFGITTADYDQMFAAQSGLCAICDKPPTKVSRGNRKATDLAVDHDHDTGAVRGLLCASCNTVLGLLGDDTDRLQAAIGYLEKHKRPKLICVGGTGA
jgi:Autographiviridae endonuclease VII